MKLSGSVNHLLVVWALSVVPMACSSRVPEEVRHGSPERSTHVRWDLSDGIAGVPWPNDALCWLDETQSVPCHPNLPLEQQNPTVAEWIDSINATRGWPTTGPIVIPFARSVDASAGPAIDLSWLLSLQQDADLSNDAIYLLDLETGLPQPLSFPTTHGSHILYAPLALDLADTHRSEPSLLVETINEQFDAETQPTGKPKYSLERDFDSDGVIDVPALLPGHPCPTLPDSATEQARARVLRDRCLADALVDTFDPGDDTLRLYPRSPLVEHRTYAVVITERLLDNRGRSIRGPFSSAVHPSQRAELQRIERWLADPSRADYYGPKPSEVQGRVRFAWTFTTSSPTADLKQTYARSKKYSRGSDPGEPSGEARLVLTHQFDLDASCPAGAPRTALSTLLRRSMALSESEGLALDESLRSIRSVASGTYTHVPFPQQQETRSTETTQIPSVDIPVWLALPKAASTSTLRVVMVSQARETTQLEALRWAGQWASLGLATLTLRRGHEGAVSADLRRELAPQFETLCSTALIEQLLAERAEVTPNERWIADVSTDLIRTRELWRHESLEIATLADLLNSGSVQGAAPIASSMFAVTALVGIGTGAAPAAMAATLLERTPSLVLVDPATSPDRAWRRGATWGAEQNLLWTIFGPRLSGIPAALLEVTRCTNKDSSLRLVTADAPVSGTEIGCLPLQQDGAVLFPDGGTVIATNLATHSRRCGRLSTDGEFSLGLPADTGDQLSLEFFDMPNVLQRFGRDRDCEVPEQAVPPLFVVGGASTDSETGAVSVPVGGLGLERQSSELRRVLDLAGAVFSGANPTPFVAALSQPAQPTDSRGMLLIVSPGDPLVPPDEGLGLAIAAKLVPQLPADGLARFPDLASDVTPLELANALRNPTAAARVDWTRLLEGVPRLQRFPPDASACALNLNTDVSSEELCRPKCLESSSCAAGLQCVNGRCDASIPAEVSCSESLADVDALANEDSPFGAIRPIPYLRLARYAGELRADNLKEMWQPQFRILGPLVQTLHPDWPVVALSLPLASPWGSHGIVRDDLCHAFRFGNYVPYVIGHFAATNGTQYAPIVRRETQQCLQAPRTTTGCDFVDLMD